MPTRILTEFPFFPHLANSEMRECVSVAYAAFEHLGKSYRIARELQPGFVDCSTIVSQSYWIGAAILTPFVAENQRLYANAVAINKGDDLLPGDAIYAYPNLAETPGGRHNHVVLFIGEDHRGIPWVIESTERSGATLAELSSVRLDGGIRRFSPDPLRVFKTGDWSSLARRVPKLGRLGCRLTAQYGAFRRHRGTDIYVEPGWAVVSPLRGTIVALLKQGISSQSFVGIWSAEKKACSLVGPVRIVANIRIGTEVDSGQLLGGLEKFTASARCNAIPQPPGTLRVHWELWGLTPGTVTSVSQLRCDWLPRQVPRGEEFRAQNPLYELKCGNVATCLRASDDP